MVVVTLELARLELFKANRGVAPKIMPAKNNAVNKIPETECLPIIRLIIFYHDFRYFLPLPFFPRATATSAGPKGAAGALEVLEVFLVFGATAELLAEVAPWVPLAAGVLDPEESDWPAVLIREEMVFQIAVHSVWRFCSAGGMSAPRLARALRNADSAARSVSGRARASATATHWSSASDNGRAAAAT